MSDVSRTFHQVLAVIDPRLLTSDAIWAAQSSYTQQGPHPGDAIPSEATPLVLDPSGAQAAGGSLTMQCVKPGLAGIGYESASFAWKQTADTLYKGRVGPHLIQGWEALTWTDGTATTVYTQDPHIIGIADGTCVLVYESQLSAGLAPYGVRARVRATDGTWGTAVGLHTQAAAPTNVFSPCLVELPDGTLICYYWVDLDLDGDTVVDTFQIQAVASADHGATWASYSDAVLEDGIDAAAYTPGRIRGAALGGQVLLVFELRDAVGAGDSTTTLDLLREVASRDRGFSYRTVRTAGTTFDSGATGISDGQGRYPEVLVFGGAFHVFHLGLVVGPLVYAFHHTTGSAFSSALKTGGEVIPDTDSYDLAAWSLSAGAGTPYQVDAGELTMAVSEEGIVNGYTSDEAAGTEVGERLVFESRDSGLTWGWLSRSPVQDSASSKIGTWWHSQDASTTPRGLAACYQIGKGRVLLAHNWDANPGNEDNSLAVAYLGGPSSITPPHFKAQPGSNHQAGWTTTWLPFDLPGDCGWTQAGAGTEALTAGALNLSTTGVQALTYTRTPTGSIIEGISLEAQVTVNSGGSIIATTTAIQVRIADGTDDYDITFRLGGTNCRIIDNNNAGATVGSDVAIDTSLGVRLKIELAEIDGVGTVRSWVRAAGAEELEWTTGPTGTVTDDVATPNANHTLVWGHVVAGAANSDWTEMHFTSDEYADGTLADGFNNPADLDGTPYAATPVGVDGPTKVTAKAGSIALDVQHVITPRYDYSIERVFPTAYPSPRQGWRSVDNTTNEVLALAYDETLLGTVESDVGNDLLVHVLTGIDWRTATLARYDVGTASWVTVASIDAAVGMTAMAYTRRGNTIIAGASSQTPYLHVGECVGWWVDLGGGKLRQVTHNTEGRWDSTFTGKRPRLILDGIDGTEGASGTLALVPNAIAIVINMLGETASGWRLTIGTQSNVSGYLSIGNYYPMIGMPCGAEPGWGRKLKTETNVRTVESKLWTRRSRKLAPRRRLVTINWSDGLDESDSSYAFGGTHPSPDFVKGSATSGSEAVSSVTDLARKLDGMLSLHDGGRIPVAYLPHVLKGPVSGSNVFVLNRRDQFVVGAGPEDVQVDTVLGDELTDEVIRVATWSILEDV